MNQRRINRNGRVRTISRAEYFTRIRDKATSDPTLKQQGFIPLRLESHRLGIVLGLISLKTLQTLDIYNDIQDRDICIGSRTDILILTGVELILRTPLFLFFFVMKDNYIFNNDLRQKLNSRSIEANRISNLLKLIF